ncbi:MAG: aldolase catalytic domain-containing protein [Thermoguttaceae bacterium]|nr:aldolase catalytic domain-containing protein [Thermoguttaceae bacterium]
MDTPWISNHQDVKVLDCTIRDGGLVNDHRFKDDFVKAVYQCCVAAGVDSMEIGYKNSDKFFSRDKMGPWKFCNEDDIRRVVDTNPTPLKLVCMMDAGKSDWRNELLPKEKSVVDIIRVAFYAHQVDEALEMIKGAHDNGYKVSANLMAVTAVEDAEIDRVLEKVSQSETSIIVIVDSFGSLIPEQTAYLTKKYVRFASATGKVVGMHAHNNQQLAFANTIEAIRNGALRVDASICGLGRGAGNCPMELILPYMRNPKYHVRPVFECMEKEFIALRNDIEWGPYPEFNITGQFNEHPRAAIGARASDEKDHYVAFYDKLKAATGK